MSCALLPGCAFATSESPVRFIEVGAEEQALERGIQLTEAGFFANLSVFPAVPRRRAGIRVMLTTHHTDQDLVQLVAALGRGAHLISEIRQL